jgi:dCMP deaminase
LVDALVSNTSDSNIVPVRSRPWALSSSEMSENPIRENKQLAIDKRYLRMARIWASNSYCIRRKVGALLVKDKMIISDGYNGTPAGFENECEDENDTTKSYVLHAEANAITKVAKSNNSSEGSTLYITTSPCMECSKLIIQAGITRVVYEEKYRITDGLDLLERARIELQHIPDSSEETDQGSIE